MFQPVLKCSYASPLLVYSPKLASKAGTLNNVLELLSIVDVSEKKMGLRETRSYIFIRKYGQSCLSCS